MKNQSKDEETQDLLFLKNSSNDLSFLDIEQNQYDDSVDELTKTIRRSILFNQIKVLKDFVEQNFATHKDIETIREYSHEEFNVYINTDAGQKLIAPVYEIPKIKQALRNIEIEGYNFIHETFKDSLQTLEWDDSKSYADIRKNKIKDSNGDLICKLTESTITKPITITMPDGSSKKISGYREIDFPTKIADNSGPMSLAMAVKDTNGKNIPAKDAVYFTAHYDESGKLMEVSYPLPIKFAGKGNDAIGYIEVNGEIYTLPVTQGKHQEMMREIAKNKGIELEVVNDLDISKDMIDLPPPNLTIDKSIKTEPKVEKKQSVNSSIIQNAPPLEPKKTKSAQSIEMSNTKIPPPPPPPPPLLNETKTSSISKNDVPESKIPALSLMDEIKLKGQKTGEELVNKKTKEIIANISKDHGGYKYINPTKKEMGEEPTGFNLGMLQKEPTSPLDGKNATEQLNMLYSAMLDDDKNLIKEFKAHQSDKNTGTDDWDTSDDNNKAEKINTFSHDEITKIEEAVKEAKLRIENEKNEAPLKAKQEIEKDKEVKNSSAIIPVETKVNLKNIESPPKSPSTDVETKPPKVDSSILEGISKRKNALNPQDLEKVKNIKKDMGGHIATTSSSHTLSVKTKDTGMERD